MKTRKQRKTERLYKKLTNLDHSPTLTVLDMEEVTKKQVEYCSYCGKSSCNGSCF